MPAHDPHLNQDIDVAWIIELWKALHGGDPTPEDVAAEVIAALSPYIECSPSAYIFQTADYQIC